MTDKLKLFKVRLASGAVRAVVAPDFAAVAQLRFECPEWGSPSPMIADAVLGIDFAGDVDFVLLREPEAKPEPLPALTRCAHCGRRFDEPGIGCTQERCADPGCACEPLRVGHPCPQCGATLRSTLGQLTCALGHQIAMTESAPAGSHPAGV